MNDLTGIALTRSKSWLASLPEVPRPPTLVTTDPDSARLFAEGQSAGVVLKPALGSGGRGHGYSDPARVPRAMVDVTRAQAGPVVAVQGYLPEAENGEKRVFWVDGRIVGGYLRKRAPGAFHHNLQRGGLPEPTAITEVDRAICSAIGPHLRRNGIVIAGLDIIGGTRGNTFLTPAASTTPRPSGNKSYAFTAAQTLQLITGSGTHLRSSTREQRRTDKDDGASALGTLTRKQVQDAIRRGNSLVGADLRGVDLNGISFDNVDLTRAKLADTNLTRCSFNGANLTHASMWHANLKDACLDQATLEGTDLDFANLDGCTVKAAREEGHLPAESDFDG